MAQEWLIMYNKPISITNGIEWVEIYAEIVIENISGYYMKF